MDAFGDDGTLIASGHAWWKVDDCGCLTSDSLADVNMKLYNYYNGQWNMVEEKEARIKPGGGSSRRVNARDVCSNFNSYKWKSVIDVDVVGYADHWDKLTTATQTLSCKA